MYIHSGHWRCCIPSSRTWTSNVRLKTPCRPSLLISDTSAGWNPVMLKAGPFPFLLFLPFFFHLSKCAQPPHTGDQQVNVSPSSSSTSAIHKHTFLCYPLFKHIFLRNLRVSGPQCSAGPRHRCSKLFMNQSIVLHSRELNAWLTQQIPVCLLLYSVWFHCVDFAQQ